MFLEHEGPKFVANGVPTLSDLNCNGFTHELSILLLPYSATLYSTTDTFLPSFLPTYLSYFLSRIGSPVYIDVKEKGSSFLFLVQSNRTK